MRFVLAGVSDHLASTLRSRRHELERARSAPEAMRMLHQPPAPRLLVVSELLPGAGDVLAAVEADCRLSSLVLVVVVGDRSTLSVALRNRGVAVLGPRGAGPRLRNLMRRPATQFQQAREHLLSSSRACADSSRRHVDRSKQLINQTRQLCALCRGCAFPPRGVHCLQGD
jgi:hypothetical protein